MLELKKPPCYFFNQKGLFHRALSTIPILARMRCMFGGAVLPEAVNALRWPFLEVIDGRTLESIPYRSVVSG